jgi:hypothetical protein
MTDDPFADPFGPHPFGDTDPVGDTGPVGREAPVGDPEQPPESLTDWAGDWDGDRASAPGPADLAAEPAAHDDGSGWPGFAVDHPGELLPPPPAGVPVVPFADPLPAVPGVEPVAGFADPELLGGPEPADVAWWAPR